MRKYHLFTCFLLAGLLTACGSSPRNEYYRLTANVSNVPTGTSPSLGIGPVEIPDYLDREKLVFAMDGNEVQLATSQNWAEPLDAGLTRVLALNLASRLDTQNVRTFPWHPKRAPDYAVEINLLTLDANTAEAQLTAEWLVYRPKDARAVQRRISQLRRALPAGGAVPEKLPAVYSDLVDDLSAQIAAAISADIAAENATQ